VANPDESTASGLRVLVWVRGRRNVELTRAMLGEHGFQVQVCDDVAALCASAEAGAGAALLAEDLLVPDAVAKIEGMLARQPAWSDFPIVVFGGGSERQGLNGSAAALGNATFLDRPVRVRSLVAAVHTALRSRRRQYEGRAAIDSRDTFLAMLGHELRNPLGAISLAVEMQQRTSERPSREQQIIARQASHLTRLVDDLLDVARVTHGKVVLSRQPVDLVQVLRATCEGLEGRAAAHQLRLTLAASVPEVWVDGDRHRLEQVFGNLINNAIKYTPPGGAVGVSLTMEADRAVVEVTDTGIGLAPQEIERIFDAFAQVDRSLARSEGGIGLGLALVRSLVDLHGGYVRATSAGPGLGSAFVVELPRSSSRLRSRRPRTPPARSVPPRRIVVVDDNADMREMFSQLLRSGGHRVDCAEDGPAGLASILDGAPDVAFVDIGLPGFDGLELARRARAGGSTTTLIAVSGYGQAEDKARAREAGFDDHVTKPISERDVERILAVHRGVA
jgi:signal transduction histidine kinase